MRSNHHSGRYGRSFSKNYGQVNGPAKPPKESLLLCKKPARCVHSSLSSTMTLWRRVRNHGFCLAALTRRRFHVLTGSVIVV